MKHVRSPHSPFSSPLSPLSQSFYLRPSLTVAPDLLGKYLVRVVGRRRMVGRIVETEAYRQEDPASHSYRGRTKRNEVMFGPGGHIYVYFTYGMHFCSNVVTGPEGHGEAVLLRAVEPVEGVALFRKNRPVEGANLTNGPAKLCQAYGIGREENGRSLLADDLFIADAPDVPRSQIARSPRIGITVATEKRWRFYLRGNAWVSR